MRSQSKRARMKAWDRSIIKQQERERKKEEKKALRKQKKYMEAAKTPVLVLRTYTAPYTSDICYALVLSNWSQDSYACPFDKHRTATWENLKREFYSVLHACDVCKLLVCDSHRLSMEGRRYCCPTCHNEVTDYYPVLRD